MATTYGAPTGLDLSACSVTATGGTTSQTLADLGKAVGDSATAAAAAQTAATDASAVATEAQTIAAGAQTTATNAQTVAEAAQTSITNLGTTYVPTAKIGAEAWVAGLDNSGNLIVYFGGYGGATPGTTYACLGNYKDNKGTAGTQYGALQFGNGGKSGSPVTMMTWNDGTGRMLSCDAGVLHPNSDNATDLGRASTAWANVYSKTAVQVTSDATQKTIIGSLGDTSYSDGQKLEAALFGLDTVMFQLNASISEKGADKARLHAGFIAQKVEAAISAAGLDPAKYALWTNSPVYDVIQVDTGSKDPSGKPIVVSTSVPKTDESGNQVYTQMLRYDQILCVMFEAAKTKITAQESALSALTARVAALEEMAGA